MEIHDLEELIKTWDKDRLSKAYKNWIIRSQVEENQEKIKKYNQQIIAVLAEWSKRPSKRRINSYKPELGLLKVMGYTVGEEGLKTNARRRILKDIINGPIPLVGDPSYMDEWGKDASPARLNKLKNCLKGFIFGGQHIAHLQALKDWKEDLNWLFGRNYDHD